MRTNSGVKNIVYNWVSGEEMSQNQMWDRFTRGAGMGILSGGLKEFYRSEVEYDIDYSPGKRYVNKSITLPEGQHGPVNPLGRGIAVRKVNNVGFNGYGPKWFREGTTKLSKFINAVPGGNAVAGLHDALGRYDWAYNYPGTVISAGVVCIPYVYTTMTIDYSYLY